MVKKIKNKELFKVNSSSINSNRTLNKLSQNNNRQHKNTNYIQNKNYGYVGSHYPSYRSGYNLNGPAGWPYYQFYPDYIYPNYINYINYIPQYDIISYNVDGSILDLNEQY